MSVRMISDKRGQIVESLRDKEYRDLLVAENISQGIAFQIRAMREDRGWTQSELAWRAGMVQEVISKLEDPDYGRFTIKTLSRLASAFDVALTVKFAAFSQLVDDLARLSPSDLAVPSFDDDEELVEDDSSTFLSCGNTDAWVLVQDQVPVSESLVASNVTHIEASNRGAHTEPSQYEYARTAQE